jgi:hypothetical protein
MLRKSIIGEDETNFLPLESKNFKVVRDMVPVNDEPVKKERMSKLIQRFISKIEENYSSLDSEQSSKIIQSKILILGMIRALFSGIIIFLGLTTFEYWSPLTTERQGSLLLIHLLIFVLSVIQVVMYLYSIYLNGLYQKYMNMIPKRINIFYYIGFPKIIAKTILYLVQPVNLVSFRTSLFQESYWEFPEIRYFNRSFNDYLLLIQFSFNFWQMLYDLSGQTQWASRKSNIRCRRFGTINNFHFILVSLSVDQSFSFAILFFVILWVFYTIVIRITESGLFRSFNPAEFPSFDEYTNSVYGYSTFTNYANCFWNVFISMSTIGYGDIVVMTTLSRVWIVLVVITGIVVVSILVVVYGNFFNFSKNERLSYNFYNSLIYKEQMRNAAGKMMINGFRMRCALKTNDYSKYRHHKNLLAKFAEDFRIIRYHYNQSKDGSDHMRNLFIRIDDTCDMLLKDIERSHPGLKAYIERNIKNKKF